MSELILISNGRVIDPATNTDARLDILIEGDRIKQIAPRISPPSQAVKIDASSKIVVPGFIDLHSHLREPGYEDRETIASGTLSAAAGGFTVVCAMPNTFPVIDTQTGVKFILDRARTTGKIKVLPVAAVTRGSQGEEITEFGDLVEHGAVAFSDDGRPIRNAEILRRALEYTIMFDVPVMDHCEDLDLSGEGVMHEGFVSTVLGLRGIPTIAETTIVARDIELAEFTGGWVHICHVSAGRSVELIRLAKQRRVRITAEVTPHHLTLTDEAVKHSGFDPNTKVKPPLTSESDRQALIQGLLDGTIDVIATDHAPHSAMEKDRPFLEAPFGVIGFETAFAVIYTELVCTGVVPLNLLIEKLTLAPAKLLKLHDRGKLSPEAIADVTIIDPQAEWSVTPQAFFSRSQNSPFIGRKLKSKVVTTIAEGKIVFQPGQNL